MPFSVKSESLRVGVATAAAMTATSVVIAAQVLPRWLSPSSPPRTPAELVVGMITLAPIASIPLVLWLLPACAVGRWVMSAVRDNSLGMALRVGLAVAAAASASLLLMPAQVSKTPGIILCCAFVVIWFATLATLTAPPVAANAPPTRTLGRRIGRTIVATLSIVAVIGWTTILGLLVGLLLGDQGGYRLVSTVDSPAGATKAYVVDRFTPGGGLGHTENEVYLLRSAEAWSDKHRGLLIWKARRGDVDTVEWMSERSVRVRVGPKVRRAHAYVRDGFTAMTVDSGGRPLP